MARKMALALLVLACLFLSALGTAMAEPAAGDTVIQKGDTSDNVILLQLRLQDLGYFKYKVTGYFGDVTEDALKDFQKANNLSADGKAGDKTLSVLYGNEAKRWKIEPRIKPKPKVIKKVKYGNYREWYTYVNQRWKRGVKCLVVDFNTGTQFYMVRVGGQYHADVAPATKSDTAKLKSVYGGEWSWDRRAVVVYINGEAIAGSINGMPHGSTGVPGNGMNLANGKLQQVCIHFKGSHTHIHNMVDPDHQRQVKRAAHVS